MFILDHRSTYEGFIYLFFGLVILSFIVHGVLCIILLFIGHHQTELGGKCETGVELETAN